MVQTGNEIGVGMLWDDGRIGGKFDSDKQWSQFGRLVKAGIRGVKHAFDDEDSPEIMIHIAEGGSKSKCKWFYDNLLKEDVRFDVIGVSFYPWWHRSLADLKENLAFLSDRYKKDIVVVEVAYPWTDKWGLPRGNKNYTLPYPATRTGQAEYLSELISIVKQTPEGRGKGVFYWAPEWISTKDFRGNWSQLTLFDFQGNALPGIAAFRD